MWEAAKKSNINKIQTVQNNKTLGLILLVLFTTYPVKLSVTTLVVLEPVTQSCFRHDKSLPNYLWLEALHYPIF